MDRRSFLGGALAGMTGTPAVHWARVVGTGDFQQVPTIEALRALEEGGGVVLVAGYFSAGDGGGGIFLWDPDAVKHDGGDAIAPAGVDHEEQAPTPGRWVRLRDTGTYNARQYGAHPDQEDNSEALQACLNAASEAGGCAYLPAGVYHVSRPLVVQPNMSLRGEGMKSVIKKTSNTNGPSLQRSVPNRDVQDAYDVDCVIAVDRPNTDLKFSPGVHIADLRIQGKGHPDWNLEERNAFGVYAPRLMRARIENVSVIGVDVGFHFNEIIVSRLSGCRASRGRIGFHVPDSQTGGGTSLSLINCYAAQMEEWGYRLRGLSYSTLVGCACDNVNKQGQAGGYFFGACHGITLAGCGCEATIAPVLRIQNTELMASGIKTYAIMGQEANRSGNTTAYLMTENATVQFTGCRFPPLQRPGNTRNEIHEDGSRITYTSSEQPSGGRDAHVGQGAAIFCIGSPQNDAREDSTNVRLTPSGISVQGKSVVGRRVAAIGTVEDNTDGTAGQTVQRISSADALEAINNNFATLTAQLERIRQVLGEEGHGLTEDSNPKN